MGDVPLLERPRRLDLAIYRGDTFAKVIELKEPVPAGQPPEDGEATDLTGYTGAARLRPDVGDPVELDVAIDGPAGRITLTLAAATTAELEASGDWDLQLTSPGDEKTTVAKGRALLDPDVTP